MKLTEKELNEFPIGTKITTELFTYVKLGKDLFKNNVRQNQNVHTNADILFYTITGVEIPTYTEYIPPKPILDEKEKEYLSSVIRPFRDKVKAIRKRGYRRRDCEYIQIMYIDDYPTNFKDFDRGTMYKGMEQDREYTLEELGL